MRRDKDMGPGDASCVLDIKSPVHVPVASW